ncbi:MAG: RidA family protein [Desulfotomaculum sp.]|nr:RidA family protein [Desulfotomaculum sp.]MCL0032650.1 RidA family protein [Peptococcaceae bacterium]MCL0052324.1 RidA family protein [Peptococcaceae bacterium]MCL0062710.1 RidA family protein [Peptococcaceae bacterium]MCL0106367.1 RidA family protein [Peptococcaceae bacterium]
MLKEIISTDKAPAAIGPYSQAVKAGNFMFISGQIPIDPSTGNVIDGDIKAQTKQCLKNLEAICQSAGLTLDNVVKTTIFITDMSKFPEVNEVYGSFFKENPPARACVEVSALPKGVQVEIEAVVAVL